MRVDIEEIDKVQAYRRLINESPINNLEIFENGKKIVIDQKILDEMKYWGLDNFYLIANRCWLTDFKESE